jgi:hypothetical protein
MRMPWNDELGIEATIDAMSVGPHPRSRVLRFLHAESSRVWRVEATRGGTSRTIRVSGWAGRDAGRSHLTCA